MPGRRCGVTDTTDRPGTLDIGLLGPVRVLRDGTPIAVGGARAETLLALLALQAGAPVAADTIVDELWAGEPPDGATTTLRSYVSRLRAALGDAAPIGRSGTGYVLDVPRQWVDVMRFEAGVRDGRALLGAGRSRRAADVLRQALELWRGEPFGGIPTDGAFRAEAVRLAELRMTALESRLEADLDAGRAVEIVDELEGLLVEHPFRERLWRHLMLALYRADRQADALAAYHRARAALDEELGLEPGDDLRALEASILRRDVPRAAARSEATLAVPSPLTSFVGRAGELAAILELLESSRLVTLVGVGGVGKTRLSLEVARRAMDTVVDAVAFVDLAALSDPELLATQVAASLELPRVSTAELGAALAERLGSTNVLLVLDNCEHLRAAAADLAHGLLTTTPGLRILATSREVLDVAGEAPYPVPPLDERDAVQLLVDRATQTRHGLRVDEAALATAARICRDLEGLPLAIELAAARAKALSLDEIAERLRDRFRFLVSWRRLTSARHRTLREAMDWSFDLLGPDEQRLLASLSVFPAGATIESVADVCLDGQQPEAERLLERLVDASLVVPVHGDLGTRYRLLETVRQYAAGFVTEDEAEGLHRRHAERARAIAAATNLGLESASHASRFDLAREELPSIRAAIQWAETADPALAVEIGAALERFWALTRPQEGIAIFSALLANASLGDEDRARALRPRGGARYASGDFAAAVEDYEAALAIHRRLGQRALQAHLLMRLTFEAIRVGDTARARALRDEAEVIGRDGRFGPDRYVSLGIEADLAFAEGRDDDAFALLQQAFEQAAEAGDAMWQIDSLVRTAEQAIERGRFEEAARAARAALALASQIEVRGSVLWILGLLARHAAATGASRRAGRLSGGLDAEIERGGPLPSHPDPDFEAMRARTVELAGEGFATGVAEGRALALDALVAEALAEA